MAIEMEDITPAKDGGVLKKILREGTGPIVPDKAIVRGTHVVVEFLYEDLRTYVRDWF